MWTRAATWTEGAALALAIVAVAALLRLSGLTATIPRHVDEGLHLYETKKLIGVARALRQCAVYWRANPPTTIPRLDLTPPQRAHVEALSSTGPDLQYARPLFNLTIAGVAQAAGFTPWVGNLTSALAGILCVLALGLLARRWFGAGPALVAMAFLATSPTHVWYSRTTFADVTAMLWLLLAMAAYDARRAGRAGLLFGVALATNPRALYQAILFLAPEAVHRDSEQDSMSGRRLRAFGLGALAAPALCEALYHVVLMAGAASGVHLVRKTYVMSFAQLVVVNTRILIGGSVRGVLHAMAAGAESPAVVALALAGVVLAMARRPGFPVAAGTWLLSVLVPLHLLTHPELRYSLMIVPFTAILAGAAAWQLAGALPRLLRAPALVALVLAGTVPQLVEVPGAPFLSPRTGRGEPSPWAGSPWPKIRADLGLAQGQLVASSGPMVFAADVVWKDAPLYVNAMSDLGRATHYVVELTHHTAAHPPRTAIVDALRHKGGGAKYEDPLATTTRMWADGPISWAGAERRREARWVEVYPLAAAGPSVPTSPAAASSPSAPPPGLPPAR